MSGDTASSTLAERQIEKRDDKIIKYEARLGLTHLPAERDTCEALDLTGEIISKFTPEQCTEAATDLANYAIYIHRVISREKGILRWLDAKINLAIADELSSYTGYYSHEQRKYVAVVNNAYARQLEELKINSQLKVDILDGLTYQINQMCRVLLEKRQQR